MSEFQEGDLVYSPDYGWGTVFVVSKDPDRLCPICVTFTNGVTKNFIDAGDLLTDEPTLFNREEGKRLERIDRIRGVFEKAKSMMNVYIPQSKIDIMVWIADRYAEEKSDIDIALTTLYDMYMRFQIAMSKEDWIILNSAMEQQHIPVFETGAMNYSRIANKVRDGKVAVVLNDSNIHGSSWAFGNAILMLNPTIVEMVEALPLREHHTILEWAEKNLGMCFDDHEDAIQSFRANVRLKIEWIPLRMPFLIEYDFDRSTETVKLQSEFNFITIN